MNEIPCALTDEEKLLCAYGDMLGAIRSLRLRVGGLAAAKQIVDEWRRTVEARDLGLSCPSWLTPEYEINAEGKPV